MKKVQWFLGIVFSLALILVLLINSFQFAAYGDFGFYEKEYKKYDVVSDLDMELKDVMYVTYEMMDYLIGDRENLDVYTVVEGKEQDFFNEQDKLHMADVKNLFLGGLMEYRKCCIKIYNQRSCQKRDSGCGDPKTDLISSCQNLFPIRLCHPKYEKTEQHHRR